MLFWLSLSSYRYIGRSCQSREPILEVEAGSNCSRQNLKSPQRRVYRRSTSSHTLFFLQNLPPTTGFTGSPTIFVIITHCFAVHGELSPRDHGERRNRQLGAFGGRRCCPSPTKDSFASGRTFDQGGHDRKESFRQSIGSRVVQQFARTR